jgi:preprotein translocase subunit SecG
MNNLMNPIQKIKDFPVWLYVTFLTISIPIFATHPSDTDLTDTFGVKLESGTNIGDTFGAFLANMLWWVLLGFAGILLIVAVIMTIQTLNMSAEDKKEHPPMWKWVTIILSVVIGFIFISLDVTILDAATQGS